MLGIGFLQDGGSSGLVLQHEETACVECRISLQKLVTLGTLDGPGAFSAEPGPFAVDDRGRYYAVISDREGEMPFVFSPDGSFLQRFGSEGKGPGEFINPRLIDIDDQGNVLVWDQRMGRLTILDSDYEVAGEAPFIYQLWDIEPLRSGDVIVSGRVRTPDLIGYAIHRFTRSGDHVASWDEYPESPTVAKYSRFLATGTDGIWGVSDLHEYTIELWDAEGTRLREIRREPDWYQPYEDFTGITPDIPPQPSVRGIWEGDEGLVWTISMREDADWAEGLGAERRNELGEEDYEVLDLDKVYDGQIEALDPDTEALVASARIDRLPAWLVAPGIVAFIREDDIGWWYADLFQVTLIRP